MSERERLREAAHELRLQIAIDGPAGAGKTTVGKKLAEILGCPYLDTGLMYRAITLLALERGVPVGAGEELCRLADETNFELDENGNLRVDGAMLGEQLWRPDVEASVSAVAAHPPVRSALVRSQQAFARDRCIVMIGRDIGTVVLRDAPVKLWVTASPEERARRRIAERTSSEAELSESQLVAELRARDQRDATRAVSPSVPAEDAVVLDTDELTPDEMVEEALKTVEQAISKLKSHAR